MKTRSKNFWITTPRGYTPANQPNYFQLDSSFAGWFYAHSLTGANKPYNVGNNASKRERRAARAESRKLEVAQRRLESANE